VRRNLVAVVLLTLGACSHAPPPTETAKVERRDDWLLALTSDIDRIAANDGFEGRVRVLHGGKPEVDRTFGDAACLPLGAGRQVLAAVAVGLLVEGGKLGWDDRLEQRLPRTAGTSLGPLTVANLLTGSAGLPLAPQPGGERQGDELDWLLRTVGKAPLRAATGTLVDPADHRPWILVESVVAQVSGQSFERFAQERITSPSGMGGTSVGETPACPGVAGGTTTLEDQFRLIDTLRGGKLVSPQTRTALWQPRLPLGPGAEVAYGFFVRTRGDQQAVGVSAEGAATAYELWLDPAGNDALVLLGRSQAKTARAIRTALGEFYALPPRPSQASSPPRRPSSK
jgi:CubicO group peptidase (beta-lactamase class C family)